LAQLSPSLVLIYFTNFGVYMLKFLFKLTDNILSIRLLVRTMKECTCFSKFAPPKAEEELAHLWVPEEAGHVVAHGGGADVHDMLSSAVFFVLAETRLVKLADRFMSSHFLSQPNSTSTGVGA
jgi:hypothetical protein